MFKKIIFILIIFFSSDSESRDKPIRKVIGDGIRLEMCHDLLVTQKPNRCFIYVDRSSDYWNFMFDGYITYKNRNSKSKFDVSGLEDEADNSVNIKFRPKLREVEDVDYLVIQLRAKF